MSAEAVIVYGIFGGMVGLALSQTAYWLGRKLGDRFVAWDRGKHEQHPS